MGDEPRYTSDMVMDRGDGLLVFFAGASIGRREGRVGCKTEREDALGSDTDAAQSAGPKAYSKSLALFLDSHTIPYTRLPRLRTQSIQYRERKRRLFRLLIGTTMIGCRAG